MRGSSSRRSLPSLLFFSSMSLHIISGFSDGSSSSGIGSGSNSPATPGGSISSKILLIFCAVVAVVVASFFLFRFWQKKKRDEQYARLLKLFEQDDELEVELGLGD